MADVNEMAARVLALRAEALEDVAKASKALKEASIAKDTCETELTASMVVCVALGMRHADIAPAAALSESTVSTRLRASRSASEDPGPVEPTLDESEGPAEDAPASSREMEAPSDPDPEKIPDFADID